MRRNRGAPNVALALLVLVVMGFFRSTPAGATDPRAVDEVLALSGVRRQIEQLGRDMAAQRDQNFKNVPPETKSRLDAIFDAAHDPATMFADVRSGFLREFDARRGALVNGFLRSPLARTLMQLEDEAQATEAHGEFRAFASRLSSAPRDPARVALLQRLDAAAGQTEMFVTITLSSLRTSVTLANVALPPNQRRTSEHIEKELELLRGRLEPSAKEAVLAKNLFAYRTVADDDLRRYVEFHDSEMGRWFLDLLNRGLRDALERSRTTVTQRSLDEIRRQDRPCEGLPCAPVVR